MKANFDISLPSIPGKSIKFKIQDIKTSAFGTQKARFADDKSLLVKKFVDSFHNFHEPSKQNNDQTHTQASATLSKSSMIEKNEKQQMKFRSMIPENKKFLLPVYQQLKNKQFLQEDNTLNKIKGGYTFNKHEERTANPEKYASQQQQLTDNYYFTQQSLANKRSEATGYQNKQKRLKPSAIFKNEPRKVVYDRLQHSNVPGPGSYLQLQKGIKKSSKKQIKTGRKSNPKKQPNSQPDYKRLKKLISKIIEQEPRVQDQAIWGQQKQRQQKMVKNSNAFVMDDRDRFGEQIFPIAPKLNVPGPGAYNVSQDTLEDKAKRIMVVEEQRKLLREWFNN